MKKVKVHHGKKRNVTEFNMKPISHFVYLILGILTFLSMILGCGKNDGGSGTKPTINIKTNGSKDDGGSGTNPTINIKTNGSIEIASPDHGIAIHDLVPAYLKDDGWVSALDYPSCITDKGDSLYITCSGLEGYPDLGITMENIRGGLNITLSVSSDEDFAVEGFRLMTSNLTFEGGEDRFLFLHNGYQSWAYAGVEILTPETGPSLDEGTVSLASNNDALINEAMGVSWWNTALMSAENRKGALVVGSLTAKRWKSVYAAQPLGQGKIRFIAIQGTNGDSITGGLDRPVTSEPIYISFAKDPLNGLIRYADAVTEHVAPPRWSGKPPMGWFSWNELFENVTGKAVKDHADILAERALDKGFDLLEIDDGWEKAWGDWEANIKFPSGMEGVAAHIKEKGLRPGLWLAPFMVSSESETFRKHPDWFLRDEGGSLIVYHGVGFSMYNLDLTHPEVLSWLKETFTRLKGYGYVFFKIDFLFGGTYEGVRYDATKTSLEAFHQGMSVIREAVGDDAYINACGAPFLPSAGWADSIRTGSDIAVSLMDLAWAFFSNQARNTAARIFAHKSLFLIDPDQALVRPPLSVEEARVSATLAALAGETFSFGDDLTRLTEDRWDILLNPHLVEIALSPGMAVPIDLFDDGNPDITPILFPALDAALNIGGTASIQPGIWIVEGRSGDVYLVLFNWGKNIKEVDMDVNLIGLRSNTDLYEVWTRESQKLNENTLTIHLPPHSVRLIYPFTLKNSIFP